MPPISPPLRLRCAGDELRLTHRRELGRAIGTVRRRGTRRRPFARPDVRCRRRPAAGRRCRAAVRRPATSGDVGRRCVARDRRPFRRPPQATRRFQGSDAFVTDPASVLGDAPYPDWSSIPCPHGRPIRPSTNGQADATAFDRMINAFYDRVEQDDLLSPFFPGGVHEEHRRHVIAWWSEVFGGPAEYTEQLGGYERMLSKHLGLGITPEQRFRFATLMSHAADDAGMPDDPEFRSALIAYLEWGTRIALGNSHRVQRWSSTRPCRAGDGAKRRLSAVVAAAAFGRAFPARRTLPLTVRSSKGGSRGPRDRGVWRLRAVLAPAASGDRCRARIGRRQGNSCRRLVRRGLDVDGGGSGAACDARRAGGRDAGVVLFSTASPPYLDKTNANAIHAALGLDPSVMTGDVGGAVRSRAHPDGARQRRVVRGARGAGRRADGTARRRRRARRR